MTRNGLCHSMVVDVTCVNVPVLTSEDKALRFYELKRAGMLMAMMREFPARQWKRQKLHNLVRKIDHTGSTDRLLCSPFPVTLQRIYNTRLKKLSLVVFCYNF